MVEGPISKQSDEGGGSASYIITAKTRIWKKAQNTYTNTLMRMAYHLISQIFMEKFH